MLPMTAMWWMICHVQSCIILGPNQFHTIKSLHKTHNIWHVLWRSWIHSVAIVHGGHRGLDEKRKMKNNIVEISPRAGSQKIAFVRRDIFWRKKRTSQPKINTWQRCIISSRIHLYTYICTCVSVRIVQHSIISSSIVDVVSVTRVFENSSSPR